MPSILKIWATLHKPDLRILTFIVFSRPSSPQIWHLKGLHFQHVAFMALNADLIRHSRSSVMNIPICLAGKNRKGISLVPAPLRLLQTLYSIKQKPDFCRVVGFAKPGIESSAKCQGRLQDEPSSISAKGSIHLYPRQTGQRPTRSSPMDQTLPWWAPDSSGRTEQCRVVRKHQNPSYWHHEVVFPFCFMLLQKETSFFNLSLCNTSAPQAGSICSTKLRLQTTVLPREGVGAPVGAVCRDAQAPGCSHAAAPSDDELAADRDSHTGTTGSPSLPVTHCKTSSICIHFMAWIS